MNVEPKYKTPRALEQAVKSAAQKFPMDTNKAIRSFYFDRLLCRIFSEEHPAFVLKGGQGMIARTLNTRSTRDIDLVYREVNVDEAVEELKRVAAIDLGDFVVFRFAEMGKIAEEQEYREGYRVFFSVTLGTADKGKVPVDLIADVAAADTFDEVAPVGRLEVAGIPTSNYLVYPVTYAMADKVCAIMETHRGGPSSRVKDLVDLVVILTTQTMNSIMLRERLLLEYERMRKIGRFEGFTIPGAWKQGGTAASYRKQAIEAHVPEEYCQVDAAEGLVRSCLENIRTIDDSMWSPDSMSWVTARR